MAKEAKKFYAPDSFMSTVTGKVHARSVVEFAPIEVADLVKKGHLVEYDAKAHKTEKPDRKKAEAKPMNKAVTDLLNK